MRLTFLIVLSFVTNIAFSQGKTLNEKKNTALTPAYIDQQLNDAVSQTKVLSALLPKDKIPRTFQGDTLVTSSAGWWTSGFYPGLVWYLYEFSRDSALLRIAQDKTALLESQKLNTRTHDLGFMLYCSFGNALRITRDTAKYKEILVTGAQSLASRFNPTVGAIRSWNMPSFPVIIDNMMNLEFLLEVSKLSNNQYLTNIALEHANTTMKNHFRTDYSCYHVIDYNPEDGRVIKKKTAQGAHDESSWARGQAWALYGYTMMYRETGYQKYLDFARKIAGFILNHPNMPTNLIPYWDFDAPNLSDTHKFHSYKENADASTASVLASALIELGTFTNNKEQDLYFSKAEKILYNLSRPPYKAKIGTNGGFILRHSVGSIPGKVEIDAPLTYADYYYVEALMRYKKVLQIYNNSI